MSLWFLKPLPRVLWGYMQSPYKCRINLGLNQVELEAEREEYSHLNLNFKEKLELELEILLRRIFCVRGVVIG